MADTLIHPVDLPPSNGASANAILILVPNPEGNANVHKITVEDLLTNSSSNVQVSNSNYLITRNLIVTRADSPANSNYEAIRGSIWFTEDYLYVAVANNVVKRVSLESF